MLGSSDKEMALISFAQSMLEVLDRGMFTTTYKYAVLLGLMDLCIEKFTQKGEPPDSVTTIQLAHKVVELYWPHTVVFEPDLNSEPLLQLNSAQKIPQEKAKRAKIISEIIRFRQRSLSTAGSLHKMAQENVKEFEHLLHSVEWILIKMPLPRVQFVGRQEHKILYEIAWDKDIEHDRKRVKKYQLSGDTTEFDNSIRFLPGIPEYLLRLNGLLRPLIHREWASMVSRINKLKESNLEQFLFGINRTDLSSISPALREHQNNRCFYCRKRLSDKVEVDHFIPWARYPNNGIENLVAAHSSCNNKKRDFLAATEHIQNWVSRNKPNSNSSNELCEIAERFSWETCPERSISIARATYLILPDEARLWKLGSDFELADISKLQAVLV